MHRELASVQTVCGNSEKFNASPTVAKWLFEFSDYLHPVGERFVLALCHWIQKPTTTVTLAIMVQHGSSVNTFSSTEYDPKSLH